MPNGPPKPPTPRELSPYLAAFKQAVKEERVKDRTENGPKLRGSQTEARKHSQEALSVKYQAEAMLRQQLEAQKRAAVQRRRQIICRLLWEQSIKSAKEIQDYLMFQHFMEVTVQTINHDLRAIKAYKTLFNGKMRWMATQV